MLVCQAKVRGLATRAGMGLLFGAAGQQEGLADGGNRDLGEEVEMGTRCCFCKAEDAMVDIAIPRVSPLGRLGAMILGGGSALGMFYSFKAMFGDGYILARLLHRQSGIKWGGVYINEALDYGIGMFLLFVASSGLLLSWYLLSYNHSQQCSKCDEIL